MNWGADAEYLWLKSMEMEKELSRGTIYIRAELLLLCLLFFFFFPSFFSFPYHEVLQREDRDGE